MPSGSTAVPPRAAFRGVLPAASFRQFRLAPSLQEYLKEGRKGGMGEVIAIIYLVVVGLKTWSWL